MWSRHGAALAVCLAMRRLHRVGDTFVRLDSFGTWRSVRYVRQVQPRLRFRSLGRRYPWTVRRQERFGSSVRRCTVLGTARNRGARAKNGLHAEYNSDSASQLDGLINGPLDLVLFAPRVRFLWSTTARTRVDRLSVRDQNGTRNKMADTLWVVTDSPARQRSSPVRP